MTVHEMAKILNLEAVHLEEDRPVSGVFCGDLLSVVMSRAGAGAAWVTVIGNNNAVAVANLTDVACIILAEGYAYDAAATAAANGIVSLFKSANPVYETAKGVGALL